MPLLLLLSQVQNEWKVMGLHSSSLWKCRHTENARSNCSQGLYHLRAICLCSNRLFLYNLSLLSWFVGRLDSLTLVTPLPCQNDLSQRKEKKTWRESVLWQNWSNSKPHASSVNLRLHWCIEEDYPLEESWRFLPSIISQASKVAATTQPIYRLPLPSSSILRIVLTDLPTLESFSLLATGNYPHA